MIWYIIYYKDIKASTGEIIKSAIKRKIVRFIIEFNFDNVLSIFNKIFEEK